MLLDTEEGKHLGKLPVGHAIVKIQDRWTSPFLIKIPLDLRKEVSPVETALLLPRSG